MDGDILRGRGRGADRVAEGGGVDQRVILLTASCYLMSSLAAETWTTIKERMIEFSQENCGSFVFVPDILAWRYPKLTQQRDSELETSFLEHGSHSQEYSLFSALSKFICDKLQAMQHLWI